MMITVPRSLFESEQLKIDEKNGVKPGEEACYTKRRLKEGKYDFDTLFLGIQKYYQRHFCQTLRYDNKKAIHKKINRFLASSRSEIELESDDGLLSPTQSRKRSLNDSISTQMSSLDVEAENTLREEIELLKSLLKNKDAEIKNKNDVIVQQNSKIEELSEKNSKLTREVNSLRKGLSEITSFFARSYGRGGHGQPSREITKFTLKLLLESQSAPEIRYVLETILKTFPMTFNSTASKISVPSETWIKNIRASIPNLHKLQVQDFVRNSNWLSLAHDSTPNSNNINYLGVLLTNEENKFIVIGIDLIADKSAKGNRDIVMKILKTNLGESYDEALRKIKFICSDRAPSALLANKMLIETMKEEFPTDRFFATCQLHLAQHLESLMVKFADCKLINILLDISILFGVRKQNGYSKESLSHDLQILAPQIKFKSLYGSRIFHNIFNLRLLITNFDTIMRVLEINSETSKRANSLLETLKKTKIDVLLRAGLISAIWTLIAKPIMGNMTKIAVLSAVVENINNVLTTLKIVKEGEISKIISSSNTIESDKQAETASIQFLSIYESASADSKNFLINSCKKIGKEIENKIRKDCNELFQSEAPMNSKVQVSNQNLEAVFGTLKFIEQRFLNLSPSMEIALTISKNNKLHTFLDNLSELSEIGSAKKLFETFRSGASENSKTYSALREEKRRAVFKKFNVKNKLVGLLSSSKYRPESLSGLKASIEAILPQFSQDEHKLVRQSFPQVLAEVLTGEPHKTSRDAREHLELLLA